MVGAHVENICISVRSRAVVSGTTGEGCLEWKAAKYRSSPNPQFFHLFPVVLDLRNHSTIFSLN